MTTTAELINKRKGKLNGRDRWIVTAVCPDCGHQTTVSFGGWTALVCSNCKAKMLRPKRVRGRPRSNPDDVRKHMTLKLSKNERDLVNKKAEAAGLTVAEFIRSRIL